MKFKVFIFSVFFVYSLLPGISLAQNKVVVIPLDSGNCDCDEIPTVTSANGRVWMGRNLGAYRVAESVDDYQAYGWLYQWGRLADGHEIRSSPTTTTLSSGDIPGHGDFITPSSGPYDWRNEQNDNLWQGVSGTNNPCPPGFRLPTQSEWETEVNSWSSQDSAGGFASPLKLVVAGRRIPSDGRVTSGNAGFYWSSTVDPVEEDAYYLYLGSGSAYMSDWFRAEGFSVRCIKD
jgi:uncharacterized protein (TIGR02145 family)